jgi:hypothetical protein
MTYQLSNGFGAVEKIRDGICSLILCFFLRVNH